MNPQDDRGESEAEGDSTEGEAEAESDAELILGTLCVRINSTEFCTTSATASRQVMKGNVHVRVRSPMLAEEFSDLAIFATAPDGATAPRPASLDSFEIRIHGECEGECNFCCYQTDYCEYVSRGSSRFVNTGWDTTVTFLTLSPNEVAATFTASGDLQVEPGYCCSTPYEVVSAKCPDAAEFTAAGEYMLEGEFWLAF